MIDESMGKDINAWFALRACAVAVVFLTVLFLLYQRTEAYSPEAVENFNQLMREVLEANARTDGEVLATRLNLSQNYDALTAHQKYLSHTAKQLLDVPSFLFDHDREKLGLEVRMLVDSIDLKVTMVERFKRIHSVFKSSQAFFEKNSRYFFASISPRHSIASAETYVRDMMIFLGDPSPDNLRRIERARTELEGMKFQTMNLGIGQISALEDLLIHGRLLEENAVGVSDITRRILTIAVEDKHQLSAEVFNEALNHVEISSWRFRIILYVSVVTLAVYLALTFLRLNGARKGLVQTNAELQKRYHLQRRAEELLRLHETAFNSAHEAIILTDAQKSIKVVNPAFERITGFSEAEVQGKDPGILKSGRHDSDFYWNMWREIDEHGRWRGEIWNRNKSGEIYPEMLSMSSVKDASGEVTNYVAVFSDISHIKRHESELKKLAYFDSLTGLPNRTLLSERMGWAMAHCKRTQSHLAVCYLDLDDFKPINDAYGHEAGDQLLIELASRFKSALRGDDTVARIGGDEFIFLFMDLKDADEYQVAVSRVLKAASQPVSIRGEQVSVSASIGVALYPHDGVDADTLMRHADQAMYEAKQKGRNCSALFDPRKDSLTRSHHEKQNEVYEALARDEFVLHYQPKVDMRTGEVVGVEALIRWQHPQKGLLMPADFLPVIEGSPITVDIGDWVIAQALEQMWMWQNDGLIMPVSVNVSAEQLQCVDFTDKLEQGLVSYPALPASNLQLEILETTALDDIVSVSHTIEKCQRLGVAVALDDFGTGYSSLTYLKRLPATILKIDRSFVQGITSDPESLALVRGIMGLARAFGRIAVAEGVESVEHGELLLKLGCDLVQGYGVSKPLPAERIISWVSHWQTPPEWRELSALHWDDEDYPLVAAGIEHHRWVERLIRVVSQGQPIPYENFGDYRRCNFGQWYYASSSQQRYGHLESFLSVESLHVEIHQLVEKIDEAYRSGAEDALQSWISELVECRARVLKGLRDIQSQVAQVQSTLGR